MRKRFVFDSRTEIGKEMTKVTEALCVSGLKSEDTAQIVADIIDKNLLEAKARLMTPAVRVEVRRAIAKVLEALIMNYNSD